MARLGIAALALLAFLTSVEGWRQFKYWNDQQWCKQVYKPTWPFAYAKYSYGPTDWEEKGRSASNIQWLGHECVSRGVRSKCNICEDIGCGPTRNETCNMQLQGVDWPLLPKNAPTVTDSPFAVGLRVNHRWDFGNADRICVMTQGRDCIAPPNGPGDYADCAVRCWGANNPDPPKPYQHGWNYSIGTTFPQGYVKTWAGDVAGRQPGYEDGPNYSAKFRNPKGIAVDHNGWVYVADTDNHVIRLIYRNGTVTTLAGTPGRPGWQDGPAKRARFSYPTSLGVYCNVTLNATLAAAGKALEEPSSIHRGCLATVVIVADTYNHRIRKILLGTVTTLAGGANRAEEERELEAHGYADGYSTDARFNQPMGVAVDEVGNVFVADTRNHVIRHITPPEYGAYVSTIAGSWKPLPYELPGCPNPCLMGIGGVDDGPARQSAKLYHPYAVAIGPGRPYTVLIVDSHRIRLLTRGGQAPFADGSEKELGGPGHARSATQQEVQSLDVVQTLAGSLDPGAYDWTGNLARFDVPKGVTFTPDGRVYVSDGSRCRIRRLTITTSASQEIQCNTRMVDIIRPPGCNGYDYPKDNTDFLLNNVQGAMILNLNVSLFNATRIGKRVMECNGVPPPDIGLLANGLPANSTGGTLESPFFLDEDTGVGTHFMVRCPSDCLLPDGHWNNSKTNNMPPPLYGGGPYTTAKSVLNIYGDESSLCAAGIHSGVLNPKLGGIILVTLDKGIGPKAVYGRTAPLLPYTQNLLTSQGLAKSPRTFILIDFGDALNTTLVSTVAGAPTSDLDTSCDFEDGAPPHLARFDGPSQLAAAPASYALGLENHNLLFIADSKNHVIRALSGACSQMCENGGNCVGPDQCKCLPGWGGIDCTMPVCDSAHRCGPRQICTAPNTCTCVAGYTNFPACDVPTCVQKCEHGGFCSYPDTCSCATGWTDANCTTPVCAQTCGNGGNCTAPNVCTCPSMWKGNECRIPVCEQICLNGGSCTAPNTCTCPPEWSGHDCSKPVCYQGFFRPDPNAYWANSNWRQPFWSQFTPCRHDDWCRSTNEFECYQLLRKAVPIQLPGWRNVTGYKIPQSKCFVIELDIGAFTPYRYERENDTLTDYYRFTPITKYGWGPTPTSHLWSSPYPAVSDRQVAIVSYVNLTMGVYACANGGDCVGVNTCKCKPGWIGFDCRIPVCSQGFYYPDRAEPRYPGQGTYKVSKRTLTIWENPETPNGKFGGYIHDHPNFHSRERDMDSFFALPTTHQQTDGLGDDTNEGWRRVGWWVKLDLVEWQHGAFELYYNRSCPASRRKMVDLRSLITAPVDDPQRAFEARVTYDNKSVTAVGRWEEADGECIDQVLLGCFNEGTCMAPNTCKCAEGWEGDDCSVPICWQATSNVTGDAFTPTTLIRSNGVNVGSIVNHPPPLPGDSYVQYRKCPHRGNCTRPNTCTCEKGWKGEDCKIPMCSQECFNGGTCVAPDVCQCVTYPSAFRDKRQLAIYAKPDENPQDTGWTGFDCNTPICTQAEKWIVNDDTGQYPVRLVSTENDGRTFQGGCPGDGRFYPRVRTRLSEELCNVAFWYQGNYLEPWSNEYLKSFKSGGRNVRVNHPNYIITGFINGSVLQGPSIKGEGIYGCFNKGSCIAPDTCECTAGWSGFDCNTPSCQFTDLYGNTVYGCRNGGICMSPNKCQCITQKSLLYEVYNDVVPGALTGWGAADCSMAMCAQGYFDPECRDVPPGVGSVSSMGAGCYRCPNGGNCTAPDTCTCAPGWAGYDCRTPVCELRVSGSLVTELNTLDLDRIIQFELDPCGQDRRADFYGTDVKIGNCTRPNVCTCMCRQRAFKNSKKEYVNAPYQDPLKKNPPVGFVYGRFDCVDGYEGRINSDGTFASCHLKIYQPTWWDLNKVNLISSVATLTAIIIASIIVLQFIYNKIQDAAKKAQRRKALKKAEKARRRRQEQEAADKAAAEAEKLRGDLGNKGRTGGNLAGAFVNR
jgi:LCCL domain